MKKEDRIIANIRIVMYILVALYSYKAASIASSSVWSFAGNFLSIFIIGGLFLDALLSHFLNHLIKGE